MAQTVALVMAMLAAMVLLLLVFHPSVSFQSLRARSNTDMSVCIATRHVIWGGQEQVVCTSSSTWRAM